MTENTDDIRTDEGAISHMGRLFRAALGLKTEVVQDEGLWKWRFGSGPWSKGCNTREEMNAEIAAASAAEQVFIAEERATESARRDSIERGLTLPLAAR